jgi:uncharacterized protein YbaA (DUF1428 family)
VKSRLAHFRDKEHEVVEMKSYVDGYVMVVKKNKLAAYKKMASEGKKTWMDAGALQYFECVGDDMNPSFGGVKMRTFPKMTKAGEDEVVIFSFVVYNSKAHRDKVNAKVNKEMEKQQEKYKDFEMPFDMKKMAYGGFTAIVQS